MNTKNFAPSALIVSLGAIALLVVLVVLFPAGLAHKVSLLFTLIFSRNSGFMLIGIGLLLVVVCVQWWQILNLQRIQTVPLSEIERLHPKLPASLEISMTVLLSTALIIFFLQLASIANSILGDVSLASSSAQINNGRDVIMSDFDADGDLDYIAGNLKATTEHHNVYRNSGTGAYTRVQQIDAATNFVAFDGGDLDADGDTDFIQVTNTAASVYLGSGTGSFNAGPAVSMNSYASPNMFTDIALGDVDSDGDLDAIVASKGTIKTHSLFRNNGKAAFTQTAMSLAAGSAVTLFDVNADDYLDIAMISTGGKLNVSRNLGTGSFLQVFSASNVALLPVIVHGDIDNDGDIDIVTANTSQQLVAWKSGGTGSFTALTGVASLISTVKTIALADIDADGDLDAVVAGLTDGEFDGGSQLLYNNGSGVFSNPETAIPSGLDNARAVAAGDIDNDNDMDWVSVNSGVANRHFKTNYSTITPNTAPSAPSSLTAVIVSPSAITGATIADTAGTGSIAWTNATNAGRSDNTYATASLTNAQTTKYLQATGFNFEVPSTATVEGIEVTIERKAASTDSLYDDAVRVVKAGSVTGTNQPSATVWSTTESSVTYGGSSDLWGTTWTPDEINAMTFGAALAVQNISGAAVIASVDNITITVYTDLYDIRLSWGSGSDTQTATRMLQYQPRVGTGSSAENILSGRVSGNEYATRVMGNAKSRTYLLKNFSCGATYYWSVRTRDHQMSLSSYATESSFILNDSCGFQETSTESTGGGWLWSILGGSKEKKEHFKLLTDPNEYIKGLGTIHISAFVDVNRDGMRQDLQERAISGLTAHVEGKTNDGVQVSEDISLGRNGEATISVGPSDTGYTFTLKESDALRNYVATVAQQPIVVGAESKNSVHFGYAPETLGYQPCLKIESDKDQNESDAVALLAQLEDLYDRPVLQNVDVKGPLVTRRAFFTLLQRFHCVRLLPNAAAAHQAKLPIFDDLPIEPFENSQLFYSLLAAEVPVGKQSGERMNADPTAFIARADAVLALRAVLPKSDEQDAATTVELPVDVPENTPLAQAVEHLASLGILPKSSWPIFGPQWGYTFREAASILTREGFIAGTISLQGEDVARHEPVPTFLDALSFQLHDRIECLEEQKDTQRFVSFKDVRPDDPFYGPLMNLIPYKLKNSDGRFVWLIPATDRLSEFGISSGEQIEASLDSPATAAEILRALLFPTCRMWLTAEQMENGGYPIEQGIARPYPLDEYFGIKPGSPSLPYRIVAEALRPETKGNLSLGAFVKPLLEKPDIYPDSYVPLTDFAGWVASTVLNIAVQQDVLSRAEAEGQVEDVKRKFLEDVVSQEGVQLAAASSIATTRGHLYYVLSVLIEGLMKFPAGAHDSIVPTTGELWSEIIRKP